MNNTTTTLSELKNFNADRYDINELVFLASAGHAIRTTYAQFNVEEPDWFTTNLKSVERAIRDANLDNLERREQLLLAEQEGLKNRMEKRTENANKLAHIREMKARV